jgi:mRNA interferase YafQ
VLTAVRSTAFKRDVERARKRGKDLERLRAILIDLIQEKALPRQYQDHPLKGEWKGYRDLHIEPDWLLIYRIVGDELRLARTGTHADIFKE